MLIHDIVRTIWWLEPMCILRLDLLKHLRMTVGKFLRPSFCFVYCDKVLRWNDVKVGLIRVDAHIAWRRVLQLNLLIATFDL